jgi:hypothetical protein
MSPWVRSRSRDNSRPAAQLTRDPKPLHEISASVPRSLSTLIMRCLAKDPARRPQTADEILHELDSMTMPIGLTPEGAPVNSSRVRRPWAAAAAVAILVAAIGSVGYVVSHSQKAPPPPAVLPAPTPAPAAKAVDTTAAKPVAPKPAPRPLLTHADSVHIAEIVRKRMEAAKISDSIAKAKLAAETERKVMDSIISANSGGGSSAPVGPRRIVIAEPPDQRNWPEAALLGRAVADSLRRTLNGRRQQYVVVDQDSVRAALAKTRGVSEISKALNADLLVAIQLQPLRGDSALLVLTSFDLGAVPQYRTRSSAGRPATKSEALKNLDQILLATLTHLDEMSRAPRRPPQPGVP